jgi:hypothetical protein
MTTVCEVTNKRTHERCDAPVCAWLTFSGEQCVRATLTVDIGVGGAKFATGKPVRQGDLVALQIQLIPTTVECKGEVCWTEDEGDSHTFGVRFLHLDEDAYRTLTDFLRTQIQD